MKNTGDENVSGSVVSTDTIPIRLSLEIMENDESLQQEVPTTFENGSIIVEVKILLSWGRADVLVLHTILT